MKLGSKQSLKLHTCRLNCNTIAAARISSSITDQVHRVHSYSGPTESMGNTSDIMAHFHTQTHKHTHKHTNIHTNTQTYTHIHIHTHTLTHTHTHTHTHIHSHTNTHTHTHTVQNVLVTSTAHDSSGLDFQ